jgi:hypothetical protein
LYIHPWELDPDQPRVATPLLTRVRHYRGLAEVAGRLQRLLSEFRFTSVERWWGGLTRDEKAGLPVRAID